MEINTNGYRKTEKINGMEGKVVLWKEEQNWSASSNTGKEKKSKETNY